MSTSRNFQGPVPLFGTVLLAAFICSCSLAAGAEEGANQQHAHVHGVATLGIAVDQSVVTIDFESPLDSLIGFEHRAVTPAERAAVEELQARMKSAAGLFRMTVAANCTLQTAQAESALFAAAAPASDEHADLDASFAYRCEHIDRLVSIDTGLFDAYPRLQRIAIAVATGKGQFKRELNRPSRSIPLSR
jgi:hypothetical protein